MVQKREVEVVRTPETATDGAGVLLKRALGTHNLSYVDPFLLLDHFGSDDPDDYIAGFPMHPHRGIETVTYLLEGSVKHRDSEGNEGTIRSGGVQWMTAGSGIIHEEMPQREGGRLEGFQLWVNLPARSKMMSPRYRELKREDIPVAEPAEGVRVNVIAGNIADTEGAVRDLEATVGVFDVSLAHGAKFEFRLPKGDNAFIYVFRGEVFVHGKEEHQVKAPSIAVLGAGSGIALESRVSASRLLLVHGTPLEEPVARYGPFVMNTRAEIATALDELSKGDFVK